MNLFDAFLRYKHVALLGLVVCCITSTFANDLGLPIKDPVFLVTEELRRLDILIEATQKSLDTQKQLRGYIVDYQKAHEEFLKNPNDNDKLFKVVKAAHKTLKTIKDNHLTQDFDSDFLDELTVLSQPATKRGIPKS